MAKRRAGPSRTKGKQAARRRGASRRGTAQRAGTGRARYWSDRVTRESDALDLDKGVFTGTARQIALSLKRSAERSPRRKAPPFRSAMSMLVFFINRAGKGLSAQRRQVLEQAKEELRKAFGRA